MQRQQSGFTLLEISIVMVIVGLLIGLTIKCQELINNSRVKSLADDFKSIQTAIYGYEGEYRALPGDDRNASAKFPGAGTNVDNGDGNASIDGNWNATSGETFSLWQHVRLAGFIQGATDTHAYGYIPLNTAGSGGRLGVSEAYAAPISGQKGAFIICSDRIPGKLVKQLDILMDDGSTSAGSLLASRLGGGEAVRTVDIRESDLYLACLGV